MLPQTVPGTTSGGRVVGEGPGRGGYVGQRGRMEPEDVLGRRWILADSGPRAIVQRTIGRPADRRRWAAVTYEVRDAAPTGPAAADRPPDPPGEGGPALDSASLWVLGAVFALDVLDTQLPDRDD
jgi:hypothetical protein